MKSLSLTICFVCLLFCYGCSATPIQKYLAENPNTPSEIIENMKKKVVSIGMTKEQVEIAAGPTFNKKPWGSFGNGYIIFNEKTKEGEFREAWIYRTYEYQNVRKKYSDSGYDPWGNYRYEVGVKTVSEATGNYTETFIFFEKDKVVNLDRVKNNRIGEIYR